jgi:HlyD family secretion protein
MSKRRWYASKYLWMTLVALGTLGGFGAYEFFTVKADKPTYIFGTVERGNIVSQVECTGTLAAVTTVQVGTQVSGTIAELYADFNSQVKKGQLLAKLDPSLFEAAVQQAEANVRTAEVTLTDDAAATASAKANLEKAKVDVINNQRKVKIQKELWNQNLISQDDLDSAQATLDASVAAEQAQQAQIDSCEARFKEDQERLSQTRANLDQAKLNLEHTIITSPISGTVISRNIDRGQTVAASFSAPTLFTIAEDLTKMQVSTNIDEADVGKIKTGMEGTFTVDAYPNETFRGKISQVRLASNVVQNVVTYNAMIDVSNPQLKLFPGMTANVKILVDKAENVLKIPNSALRFKPNLSDQEMETAYKAAGEEKYYSQLRARNSKSAAPTMPASEMQMSFATNRANANNRSDSSGRTGGTQGPNSDTLANRSAHARRAALWVLGADKSLQPVVVTLGLTDGVQTEIEPGKLKEGDKIITGEEVAQASRQAPSTTTRPPGFGGPGGMRGIR